MTLFLSPPRLSSPSPSLSSGTLADPTMMDSSLEDLVSRFDRISRLDAERTDLIQVRREAALMALCLFRFLSARSAGLTRDRIFWKEPADMKLSLTICKSNWNMNANRAPDISWICGKCESRKGLSTMQL